MTRTLAMLVGLALAAPALAAPTLSTGDPVAAPSHDAVLKRVFEVYRRYIETTDKGKMDVAFQDFSMSARELTEAEPFPGWRVFMASAVYGRFRPHDPAWVLVRGDEVRVVQLFLNKGRIMQGGGRLKIFGCHVEGIEAMAAASDDMDAYIRASDRHCMPLGDELYQRVKGASPEAVAAEARQLSLLIGLLHDGGYTAFLPDSEDEIPGDMMQKNPLEFAPFAVKVDERGRVWSEGFWLRTAPAGTRALRQFLVLVDSKGFRLEMKPIGTWPAEM